MDLYCAKTFSKMADTSVKRSTREISNLFPSKALVLLIGASKGFGRSVAIEAAKKWRQVRDHAELKFVLIGRDENLMQETGEAVKKELETANYSIHKLDVSVVDDAFEKRVDAVFASESFADFDAVYLIHNSGWVQPTCYLQNATSKDIRRSVNLNFTSFSILNARFLHRLLETVSSSSSRPGVVRILQISSLAGLQPFPSLPVYSSVKAARDMLMRVVAAEMKECKEMQNCDLKTLSWAPGQLATDMMKEVRECEDANVRAAASNLSFNVETSHSASLMWKVVAADTFESAEHVDVFDVIKSL
ncbi:oxidoreductase, short chain dehydrogenase/reductase family protein [Toxoplasma gondii ME49]|uniref:Oxidoreductase, short chain dehydrogenase/reductase family protein n=9 Tax=Toxoplasma gondii TaxID=5811 RepID=B6KJP0_TOXGV|nr:oxidoreductase, short chain dehydrogenase/reductase family protein [Toxoplasma gondii ME49]ESS35696.1 oxidoreductase, short chain dehydrogenase/reductase family protein [Toxoplasma gondii VEG]KFG63727.1 oxidoreductase, short chain dehydrogenase/reductase family protein [Toxoplasma gondii RUB]KYF46150.1 oxidoreductase, short chain dehydrogenase/reductase family protein [Toxoplasma gondii ARI]PIM03220.1 oxidoreductase, short chain dehydrogenase/reductase family protein [Toxoplasma gondii COUG]|eukprot:XP_002368063.1 oxidoreductase, short chain dehydrogenase/reductase family protein [Toxoplasma gondii ME49]